MNWIDTLLMQYSEEANKLKKYRESLDPRNPLEMVEAETVSGMISDLRFAIDWMRRGRRPGNRRGVDRTDIYRQRELIKQLQSSRVQKYDVQKLVQILLEFSDRERTCFLLHMAHGLTISDIAESLNISRTSVQSYILRARKKIQRAIS